MARVSSTLALAIISMIHRHLFESGLSVPLLKFQVMDVARVCNAVTRAIWAEGHGPAAGCCHGVWLTLYSFFMCKAWQMDKLSKTVCKGFPGTWYVISSGKSTFGISSSFSRETRMPSISSTSNLVPSANWSTLWISLWQASLNYLACLWTR